MGRHLQFFGVVSMLVVCFLLPSQALAVNDGVWFGNSNPETQTLYFMITQVSNGNYALIEFSLDPGSPYYVAYYGPLTRLDLVLDSEPRAAYCPADYFVLQFMSEGTGMITLYHSSEGVVPGCSRSYYGVPFQLTRF